MRRRDTRPKLIRRLPRRRMSRLVRLLLQFAHTFLNLRKTPPESHENPTSRTTTKSINAAMKSPNRTPSPHPSETTVEQTAKPARIGGTGKIARHPLQESEAGDVVSNTPPPHYRQIGTRIPVGATPSSRRLMLVVERMEERSRLSATGTLDPYPGRPLATKEQALVHNLDRSIAFVRAKVMRRIEDECRAWKISSPDRDYS